jgi:asparagine synthase (glutamine-hydrolysing)
MAGLCGVIGNRHHVETIATDLEWTGEETTTKFADDHVAVVGSFTQSREAKQPVQFDDGALFWIWGSVFGAEREQGYVPRDFSDSTTAGYCAELYDQYGLEFVSRLNGDFFGVVYDRANERVSVFTDRLGLRDAYYTKPTSQTVALSTKIQSLSRHPEVTPAFERDFMTEYFCCHHRTFGVKTPLQDTFLFPPGAVTSIDTQSGAIETESYWQPRYEPLDRPFSYFLDRFTELFSDAVSERMRPEREYGLLLSGGTDSRLVLAATGESARENLTAYHMADWMSREARTAETVALTAGVDFEWLKRDRDYHERGLARNPSLSNFVGTFQQAHAEGFMPDLRTEVDEMLTASFADSMFKGYSFPRRRASVGPLSGVSLPAFEPMDSIEAYLDFWVEDPPPYLVTDIDPETVLRREIQPTDDGVDHHGITYGSPRELFICGQLTPRTNGSVLFTLQSLRQHVPAWSPFVDNRLVDLFLSMPTKFFARRNIIRCAVERLDPALADIRSANTLMPVSSPFPAHYLGRRLVHLSEDFLPWFGPPEPHMSNGPWPNIAALVRNHPIVEKKIRENERIIRALPFLDLEAVWEVYREHLDGTDRYKELYGLLSLLEMPVTKRIARVEE